MSLLMQALRKAERARAQNGHDAEHEQQPELPPFDADAIPSPPPTEGGPAFGAMPDAWRLEPLDAEPPVVAAQEAAHDPVPPQARHEQARTPPPAAGSFKQPGASAGTNDGASPGATRAAASSRSKADSLRRPGLQGALASSQRRLVVLAGTLSALLAVFAFIYWRAVSAPGPGARLPMVPMPAPGSPPVAQTGTQQGTPIPVTPYVTPLGVDPGLQGAAPAGAAEAAGTGGVSDAGIGAPASASAGSAGANGTAGSVGAGTAPAAMGAKAPASRPNADVTIPTPEQLAAITDPAIRAEAMRDAAERAARQVRAEGAAQAPAPIIKPAPPQAVEHARREASTPALKTAIGDTGNIQFVRSAASIQVAPAVQNGYAALKSGDLATAQQQYELALLQDPNNRDALLGAAAVALREHDGGQASSNYLRLLELDPNDPDALAGLAELRPGDLQANEIKLRGLARQHPDSGPVQFALGNLFARQGRWPEAQQSYFRAFSALPDNADYAFNLGVGLDRMNQPRLALTYYRRALELAQASPPAFDIDAVRKRLQVLETPPR